MTEQAIIDILSLGQRTAPNRCGIGDDAALLYDDRVVTQDTMVEGIHWDDKLTSEDVGWKLVAVNVSDIAAMGGFPEWATLSLSVPDTIDESWVRNFSSGMRQALTRWNISLVGGDTTRSPNCIVASMTMGSRRQRSWAWQHTATIGEDIWVTGALGEAASGFFHPDKHPYNTALQRPIPPVEFGHAIQNAGLIHAMTDISDGLHKDLEQLCSKSNVGALINPKDIPASSTLYKNRNALSYQVAFGEDYELLFTAPRRTESVLRKMAARHRVTIHRIGKTTKEEVILQGAEWPPSHFTHFSKT